MEAIELLQKHCEFNNKYDIYVLLAVSRRKDSKWITNYQEIVFREVIKSEKDIVRKYQKIKALAENYEDEEGRKYPFYLYVTLNARDSLKTMHNLMKQMLNWLYEDKVCDNEHQIKRLKRIDSYWYSQLMKPESRSTSQKYFMIDFDEKSSIGGFESELKIRKIPIELIIETKNGWHVKTKPFDVRLLDDLYDFYNFEIKKDSNLFVEYINARVVNK